MTVDVLPVLLTHAGELLRPLLPGEGGGAVDIAGLLRATGWQPSALLGLDLEGLAQDLSDLGVQLRPVLENPPQDVLQGALALAQMARPFAEVAGALASWSPPSGLPADLGETLLIDLAHALVDDQLYRRATSLHGALRLVGLIKIEAAPAISHQGKLLRQERLRPRIALEPLGRLLTEPGQVLQDYLDSFSGSGAGTMADLVADAVGPLLADVLRDRGLDVTYGAPGIRPDTALTSGQVAAAQRLLLFDWLMPTVGEAGEPLSTRFRVVLGVTETSRGLGLVVGCSGAASLGFATETVRVVASATGLPEAVVVDRQGVTLAGGGPASDQPAFRVDVVLPGASAPLALRLGDPAGTRFEIGRIAASLAFDADGPDVGVSLDLQDVKVVVSGGNGDGFLAKVLPTSNIEAVVDVVADWSSRRGLRVRGGGQLDVVLPLHASLGPLQLLALRLGLGVDATGVEGRVAVDLRVELGPIKASVERFGIGLALAPAEGGGGDLGALSLRPRILPPLGASLKIDGAAVTGGGYVSADHDKGRYAGILQVHVVDTVSVTAIGLLVTRRPDGSDGFSLLVLLTAQFPPVQLGMGFVLTGLGGLVGISRTMDVDALRAGVLTGGLDSVLFPREPVVNAAKVVRDLEAFFPVAEGRFTVGLMAGFGWGSPPLVTLELGVLLELPAPVKVVLLGRLSAVLPTEKAAVLVLQVDILGVLDFGRCEVSIDATLRDSRVACFTLTGDLAVRLSYGAASDLALSCGGFNPRFRPPPDFPVLRRLAITLATGNNPRLRLEAYFATTATSVQVGARLDVYAEVDLGLLGTYSAAAFLGFDALLTLSPRFSFVVDLGGGVMIRRNGTPFLGAEVLLTLEGPEPFRFSGYAEFHFFGTHRIPLRGTIGNEPPPVALPIGDPVGDLLTALALPASWGVDLPPGASGAVGLRELGAEADASLLLHPFGALQLTQRVAPLDTPMERYGGARPPAADTTLALVVRIQGKATEATTVLEPFAASQVFELDDEEKLTAEAFPRLPAGRSGIRPVLSPVTAPPAVDGEDGYETAVISALARETVSPAAAAPFTFAEATLDALVASAAAARADVRTTGAAGHAGPPIGTAVLDPAFMVVTVDTLTSVAGPFASSFAAARAAGSRPGTRVVAAHETAVS